MTGTTGGPFVPTREQRLIRDLVNASDAAAADGVPVRFALHRTTPLDTRGEPTSGAGRVVITITIELKP